MHTHKFYHIFLLHPLCKSKRFAERKCIDNWIIVDNDSYEYSNYRFHDHINDFIFHNNIGFLYQSDKNALNSAISSTKHHTSFTLPPEIWNYINTFLDDKQERETYYGFTCDALVYRGQDIKYMKDGDIIHGNLIRITEIIKTPYELSSFGINRLINQLSRFKNLKFEGRYQHFKNNWFFEYSDLKMKRKSEPLITHLDIKITLRCSKKFKCNTGVIYNANNANVG